jgi:argininosuccinate synthase
MVEIARREHCTAIAHGATGKGNDQVRFELTVKALAPDLKIIAPWRIWDIKSRDEEIDYANARGIPVPVTKASNYSMDQNLWHLSHEGMDLENPANEPQYEKILQMCVPPEKAPDQPTYVEIEI